MVLLLMIKLSSLKSGQSILYQYCSIAEHYCPPTYECRPREQRCTESDNCTYPNNDMCFSNGSKKSYPVSVGYAPLIKVIGINVISHRFIQYRGFTYEYFPAGVEKLDIATHYYTKDVMCRTADPHL